MRKIFSVLSKEGTLTILKEADPKLISRTETPNELGLTKRQYYSRVRELKDLNLIKKKGEGYVQTDRGEKTVRSLGMFSPEVCDEKTEEVGTFPDVNSKANPNQNGATDRAEVYTDYDELVEKLLDVIEGTSSEINLASKYIDYRVIRSTKHLLEEDQPDFRLIVNQFTAGQSVEIVKAFPFISSLKEIKSGIISLGKVLRVLPQLPYSFFVSDRKISGIEITDPSAPSHFYASIVLENEEISRKLNKQFDYLFESSDEIPEKNPTVDSKLGQSHEKN